MKVLVTGARGQLGVDLLLELSSRGTLFMGIDLNAAALDVEGKHFKIEACDITNRDAVFSVIKSYAPDSVIHCAAYTAVDRAEDESELCFRINRDGTENIVLACRATGAEMIYISTDYVFDGVGDKPYETETLKNPLSVYGASKSAGEDVTAEHLSRYYIVRISGVFGAYGANIAKTFARLAGERDEISVVNDQIGSPTYTADLVPVLCDMVLSGKYGIYHVTNEGFCSWAEFAEEIVRVTGSSCRINPITSEQYPTKAKRPKNWRLSKTCLDAAGIGRLPHWKDAVNRFFNS